MAQGSPSIRQVRNYVVECIKAHLAPDALACGPCNGDGILRIWTRKAGTKREVGAVFLVTITRVDEEETQRYGFVSAPPIEEEN